jgi:tetratricopeptide (TPR) repeat protein
MRRLLLFVPIVLLMLGPAGLADDNEAARLDALFAELQRAPDAQAAQPIEAAIWSQWMATGRPETDALMLGGIAAMQAGDFPQALAAFDRLVAQAPDRAEAWNKRATLHYLMDNFEASVADIQRTLALEPRHFGALSGLGLIYVALGNEEAALRAFEKALSVHPHLRGPSQFVEALRRRNAGSPI